MTSMSSSSVRPNSLANLTAVPMRYTPHFCPPFHWGMGMGSPFPNCCGNTSHLQPWELARPIPALGKGRRGRLLHVVLPEEDFGGDLLHGLGTNRRHARGLQPPPQASSSLLGRFGLNKAHNRWFQPFLLTVPNHIGPIAMDEVVNRFPRSFFIRVPLP